MCPEKTAHFKAALLLQAQQEHQAGKQPAVLIAANPALAKARDPGKTSGKAKRKKRQRDSRAVEPDPGEHSPCLTRFATGLCLQTEQLTAMLQTIMGELCRPQSSSADVYCCITPCPAQVLSCWNEVLQSYQPSALLWPQVTPE